MRTKLFLSFFFIMNVPFVFAKTWKVEKNGLGDFMTISQALNVAQPGDTIKVFPGTYTEKVVLSKNVVIQGSGTEATVIANPNNDYGVVISAGKIMWFTITAQGNGVKATGGLVANCVVKGCKYSGFDAYTGGRIVHCISTENAHHGFYISQDQDPVILNCIAYTNANGGFQAVSGYNVTYCCSYGNGWNWGGDWYGGDARKSTGSIEADPKFEPNSYNISASSPCTDTGNVAYIDPDGTKADIGYYGGNDAPTFPVVQEAKIVLNPDGTITIQATGISNY